jgi:ATP-dependent helicase/nuclease subunit A
MTGTTPSASHRNWTPQQRAAITTVGHSLLVSAAAGSGKTAVLTERCAHLVCDATEPCGVDELLVVTFTEAAAAEMRQRVRDALARRAARSPGEERVVHQLASVERATIGTLHSFCGRLLRQHFHAAGLDPDFAILDGDAAALMKRDTARQLIAARFAADGAPTQPFTALLDGYFNGDDGALAMEVLSIYETLTALPDPARWLGETRKRLHDAATAKSLNDSALGKAFVANLARDLAALSARIASARRTIQQAGDFPKYLDAVAEAAAVASLWETTLREHGVDALAEEAATIEPSRLPALSNALPGKAIAKGAIDDIRNEMKDGPVRRSLKFKEAEWRDGMAATLAPAEELLALVEAFTDAYTAAKERLRSLDFSDLEHRTLALLTDDADPRRPSRVARGCHQRFRHVLVDEYQDINDLQESILKLVSRECLRAGPADGNLFCVGDVKQSIYRFRAAEPRLFLDRYARFKQPGSGGEVIDLSQNFRSRAPLLGAVNEIFGRLMTQSATEIDYTAGHRLVPGATFPNAGDFPGAPVELHLLPAKPQTEEGEDGAPSDADTSFDTERPEREAMFIVQRIKALMGQDGSPRAQVATKDRAGTRDIRFGDIAVLLRTRKFKIEQYADVLRKSGIPVLAEGGSGFFSAMEVTDVLSLLRLLDNVHQDLPLAAVLRSPLGGLPEPEDSLARIRLAYPDADVPFHVAVHRYADEQDDELAARLRDILAQLSAWRELAQRRPLAEVIATVYEQSGYLAFVCGLADGAQRKANLLELHRRATQFGHLADNGGGLSRFLNFLEQLEEEVDAGQATVTASAVDAVQIVTVHKSKGLEFPVVFVADLGKMFNLQDAAGSIIVDKDEGLGLQVVDEARYVRYPSLATTVIAPRLTKKMLAEELRVLYVALTRAEEHLILVGTSKANAVERWQSRWPGHIGPLPDETILHATTPLDWLGPVAVAAGPAVIAMTEHTAPPTTDAKPVEIDAEAVGRLARLASLKPLEPAPPNDSVATDIIARLTFAYPHRDLTRAAAAESVTKRAHAEETLTAVAPPASSHDARPSPIDVPTLPQPRFVVEQDTPGAADAGTATHLVLEHFDFHQPATSIPAQIATLVERRLMPPHLARVVDIASIEWLLASKVGRLLAHKNSELFRELPVFFAAPVAGSTAPPIDPRDRVMVRGRVDLFVRTPPTDFIIDYKTDRVSGRLLDERIAAYRAQLLEYATAIASAVTQRKPAIWLVFLSKREIVEL